MIAYADTGFLVSLYGEDHNSATASLLVASRPTFILTSLVETEFANALELRVFRKEWTKQQARRIRELFHEDQSAGLLRSEPLGLEIWEKAVLLCRRHSASIGTRTLDVLHVGTVSLLKPDVFYTFDERQRRLAKAERIRVLPA